MIIFGLYQVTLNWSGEVVSSEFIEPYAEESLAQWEADTRNANILGTQLYEVRPMEVITSRIANRKYVEGTYFPEFSDEIRKALAFLWDQEDLENAAAEHSARLLKDVLGPFMAAQRGNAAMLLKALPPGYISYLARGYVEDERKTRE